ncbi:lanthionine synthetase C family protein [Nocardiopsis sp. EMB25]|uniref:lanthionine synthetase C family protein n=1 Tax=Nocardiopsis sp. EMB25 TaxID=2835867 RepID=UPI00228464D7|nr:lanthionine synthetase C family protein [Nocardiopsis sp. EMB25]MCY9783942.1 lanthionine synthetase C family protein [Nocardiopsis sp. EMB25]
MTTRDAAAEFVARVADQLAHPPPTLTRPPQCLDRGAAGVALFHAVRARHDAASAERAHAWLRVATVDGADASGRSGLLYGLPALVLVLSLIEGHYERARGTLVHHLNSVAHQRVEAAQARMASGVLPSFGEYDLISGLAGIGVVLLRADPGGSATGRVLEYLVRLSQPVRDGDGEHPGWWVHHDPWYRTTPGWEGGHANLGMAHGAAGVLAVLSLAHRTGSRVDGHLEAIERICRYLDIWRQDDEAGVWWPAWVRRNASGRRIRGQDAPGPPSWCYGTPGLARAQQLAAIATGDTDRRRDAETAMAMCMGDPAQRSRMGAHGLCHGRAGLLQVLRRMAADQQDGHGLPRLADRVPLLTGELLELTHQDQHSHGLLEGTIGTALALTTETASPSWDACLAVRA